MVDLYIHFYEHELNVPTLINKVPLSKTSNLSGIGSSSRVQVISGLGAPNVRQCIMACWPSATLVLGAGAVSQVGGSAT